MYLFLFSSIILLTVQPAVLQPSEEPGETGRENDVTCGGTFFNTSGELESPGITNGTYYHDLNCTWILIVPEGMTIRLEFIVFHLELDDDCAFDYLNIYRGTSMTDSEKICTYCGLHEHLTIYTTNEVLLNLVSDSSNAGAGFHLRWQAIGGSSAPENGSPYCVFPGSCSYAYYGSEGTIKSPGFDSVGRYFSYLDCTWEIAAPAGKVLEINFDEFEIEPGESCNYDRLQIEFWFGDNNYACQYCGMDLPAGGNSTVLNGDRMAIRFITDTSETRRGFSLTWRAVDRDSSAEFLHDVDRCEVSETCRQDIYTSENEMEGTIVSPWFYTDYVYPSQVSCMWKINVEPGMILSVTAEEFEVESTEDCHADYLSIYVGLPIPQNRICKYCGQANNPSLLVQSETDVTIQFISDTSEQLDGFLLKWEIEPLAEQSSTAVDPTCVTRFATEPESAEPCNFSVSGSGGTLVSPGHPDAYPPETLCLYEILAPEGMVIELIFEEFDMEKKEENQCQFDFIEILSEFVHDSGPYEASCRFCGATPPGGSIGARSYGGQKVALLFSSDEDVNKAGFRFNWTSVPQTSNFPATELNICQKFACDEELFDSTGILFSPGHLQNEPYPNNVKCTWKITVAPEKIIHFDFFEFHLEADQSCEYDSLTISTDSVDEPRVVFCGTRVPTEGMEWPKNYVKLTLTTDETVSKAGFAIQWRAELPKNATVQPEFFMCLDSQNSVPFSWVCDGIFDCVDNSDEDNYAGCNNNALFTCGSGETIQQYDVCDGNPQCSDNSDEGILFCLDRNGIFFCPGSPIPMFASFICDGYGDCIGGEDESEAVGCFGGESCKNDTCKHRGRCLDLLQLGIVCECDDPWGGLLCETDIINDCDESSCAQGSICVDWVWGYFCVCPPGKTGDDCSEDVPTIRSYDVFVSLDSGSNDTACGVNATYPCSSIRDAVIKTTRNQRIILKPSKYPYVLQDLWITHSLTFASSDTSTRLVLDNVKFTPLFSRQDEMNVKFNTLSVESRTYVLISNVSMSFTDCNVTGMRVFQNFIPREDIQYYGLKFLRSNVSKSIFDSWETSRYARSTNDTIFQYAPDVKTLRVQLVAVKSTFDGCLINMTAIKVQILVEGSNFTNESNEKDHPRMGLVIAMKEEDQVSFNPYPPEGVERRKKRSALRVIDEEGGLQQGSFMSVGDKPSRHSMYTQSHATTIKESTGKSKHRPFDHSYLIKQSFHGRNRSSKHDQNGMQPVKNHANKRSRTKRDQDGTNEDKEEGTSNIRIAGCSFTGQGDSLNFLTVRSSAVLLYAEEDFNLEVVRSTFKYNNRGIIVILPQAVQAKVNIREVQFTNNTSIGPGAGIQIYQTEGVLRFKVAKSQFEGNVATELPSLLSTNSNRRDSKENAEPPQMQPPTGQNIEANLGAQDSLSGGGLSINDPTQVTGAGGAIAVTMLASDLATHSSTVLIEDSIFHQNTATNYGGTLYFTPGVTATLLRCNMSNSVDRTNIKVRVGEILESRGSMVLQNVSLSAASANSDVPVVSYRAYGVDSFLSTSRVTVNCPVGYIESHVFNAVQKGEDRMPIESLLVYCRACYNGFYSLGNMEVMFDQPKGLVEFSYLKNSSCSPCVYGATCQVQVKAKLNFWGEVHAGKPKMYSCPEGYCCQSEFCPAINTCAPLRTGVMCGRCKDGYAESMFSAGCIPDEECSSPLLFIVVVCAYGILYVIFFICQEEIEYFSKSFFLWAKGIFSKKKASPTSESSGLDNSLALSIPRNVVKAVRFSQEYIHHTFGPSSINSNDIIPHQPEVDKEEDTNDSAMLQIFMYFVQVSSLLQLSILYESGRMSPLENILNQVQNIFSFNTFGIQLSTCVFPGTTAVIKTVLQLAFILFLFIIWLLFALGSFLGRCCCSGSCKCKPIVNISVKARYLGALVNIMLYTYQYFAENALVLLRCVTVSSGDQVLYIDGNVKCYQYWQYIFLAFFCSYVLPFFLVLLYAPSLLDRRLIGVRTFFVGLMFPLFCSPYLMYKFYQQRRRDNVYESHPDAIPSETSENENDEVGSVDAVVGIIFDPYKKDIAGGLCWEGVIAFRRLLIVIVATLISNVLIRHIMLLLLCAAILVTHVLLKPFVMKVSNIVEGGSLTILLCVSIFNLLKATYYDFGEFPRETADKVFLVYDWFEAILFSIVPMIVVSLLVLAVVVRVITMVVNKCTKPPEREQENMMTLYTMSTRRGVGNPAPHFRPPPSDMSSSELSLRRRADWAY